MRSSWRINDFGIRDAFVHLEEAGLLRFLHSSASGQNRRYVFEYRDCLGVAFTKMSMTAEQLRAEFLV